MITGDEPATGYGYVYPNSNSVNNKGITIRQQFAMAAMQGLCACPGDWSINEISSQAVKK